MRKRLRWPRIGDAVNNPVSGLVCCVKTWKRVSRKRVWVLFCGTETLETPKPTDAAGTCLSCFAET